MKPRTPRAWRSSTAGSLGENGSIVTVAQVNQPAVIGKGYIFSNGGANDATVNAKASLGAQVVDNPAILQASNGSATSDTIGTDTASFPIGRALSREEIATIAGMGQFAGIGLDSASLDNVLGVFHDQTGTAAAGSLTFGYTTAFALPNDASTLYLGKHYAGVDGNNYIILGGDGTTVAFSGVMTVPEPAAFAALSLAGFAVLRRRRQSR